MGLLFFRFINIQWSESKATVFLVDRNGQQLSAKDIRNKVANIFGLQGKNFDLVRESNLNFNELVLKLK